jgi:hypothetical protein
MTKTKALAIVLLLVCLPLSAFGTVVFSNVKGKLQSINTGSGVGLTVGGRTASRLIGISGIPNFSFAHMNRGGSVSFSTGDLLTGSLAAGASFAAGGSFNVIATNGVEFHGTFTDATWSLNPGSGPGNWAFSFSGDLIGTLITPGLPDREVNAATIQLSGIRKTLVNPFHNTNFRKLPLAGGTTTTLAAVPEADTLSLLGIGFIAVALFPRMVRRKRFLSTRH